MVAPITANGDTLDIVHLMRPNLHNALTTSSATSPRGAAATAAAAAAAGGGSPTASNAIADRPATARARLEGGGGTGPTAKARRAKSPRAKSPGMRSDRGSGGGRRSSGGSEDRTPEVFNRLADPARFTGHHKHRFDDEKRGRGLAGRDSTVKGGGTTVDPHAQVLGLRDQKKSGHDSSSVADRGEGVSRGQGQMMQFSPRAAAAAERERATAALVAGGGSPRLSSDAGSPRSPRSPRQRLVREV